MTKYVLKMMPTNDFQKIVDKLVKENINYNMSIYDGRAIIYIESDELDDLIELMNGYEAEGLKIKNSIYPKYQK
jgi:hypothetical protein